MADTTKTAKLVLELLVDTKGKAGAYKKDIELLTKAIVAEGQKQEKAFEGVRKKMAESLSSDVPAQTVKRINDLTNGITLLKAAASDIDIAKSIFGDIQVDSASISKFTSRLSTQLDQELTRNIDKTWVKLQTNMDANLSKVGSGLGAIPNSFKSLLQAVNKEMGSMFGSLPGFARKFEGWFDTLSTDAKKKFSKDLGNGDYQKGVGRALRAALEGAAENFQKELTSGSVESASAAEKAFKSRLQSLGKQDIFAEFFKKDPSRKMAPYLDLMATKYGILLEKEGEESAQKVAAQMEKELREAIEKGYASQAELDKRIYNEREKRSIASIKKEYAERLRGESIISQESIKGRAAATKKGGLSAGGEADTATKPLPGGVRETPKEIVAKIKAVKGLGGAYSHLVQTMRLANKLLEKKVDPKSTSFKSLADGIIQSAHQIDLTFGGTNPEIQDMFNMLRAQFPEVAQQLDKIITKAKIFRETIKKTGDTKGWERVTGGITSNLPGERGTKGQLTRSFDTRELKAANEKFIREWRQAWRDGLSLFKEAGFDPGTGADVSPEALKQKAIQDEIEGISKIDSELQDSAAEMGKIFVAEIKGRAEEIGAAIVAAEESAGGAIAGGEDVSPDLARERTTIDPDTKEDIVVEQAVVPEDSVDDLRRVADSLAQLEKEAGYGVQDDEKSAEDLAKFLRQSPDRQMEQDLSWTDPETRALVDKGLNKSAAAQERFTKVVDQATNKLLDFREATDAKHLAKLQTNLDKISEAGVKFPKTIDELEEYFNKKIRTPEDAEVRSLVEQRPEIQAILDDVLITFRKIREGVPDPGKREGVKQRFSGAAVPGGPLKQKERIPIPEGLSEADLGVDPDSVANQVAFSVAAGLLKGGKKALAKAVEEKGLAPDLAQAVVSAFDSELAESGVLVPKGYVERLGEAIETSVDEEGNLTDTPEAKKAQIELRRVLTEIEKYNRDLTVPTKGREGKPSSLTLLVDTLKKSAVRRTYDTEGDFTEGAADKAVANLRKVIPDITEVASSDEIITARISNAMPQIMAAIGPEMRQALIEIIKQQQDETGQIIGGSAEEFAPFFKEMFQKFTPSSLASKKGGGVGTGGPNLTAMLANVNKLQAQSVVPGAYGEENESVTRSKEHKGRLQKIDATARIAFDKLEAGYKEQIKAGEAALETGAISQDYYNDAKAELDKQRDQEAAGINTKRGVEVAALEKEVDAQIMEVLSEEDKTAEMRRRAADIQYKNARRNYDRAVKRKGETTKTQPLQGRWLGDESSHAPALSSKQQLGGVFTGTGDTALSDAPAEGLARQMIPTKATYEAIVEEMIGDLDPALRGSIKDVLSKASAIAKSELTAEEAEKTITHKLAAKIGKIYAKRGAEAARQLADRLFGDKDPGQLEASKAYIEQLEKNMNTRMAAAIKELRENMSRGFFDKGVAGAAVNALDSAVTQEGGIIPEPTSGDLRELPEVMALFLRKKAPVPAEGGLEGEDPERWSQRDIELVLNQAFNSPEFKKLSPERQGQLIGKKAELRSMLENKLRKFGEQVQRRELGEEASLLSPVKDVSDKVIKDVRAETKRRTGQAALPGDVYSRDKNLRPAIQAIADDESRKLEAEKKKYPGGAAVTDQIDVRAIVREAVRRQRGAKQEKNPKREAFEKELQAQLTKVMKTEEGSRIYAEESALEDEKILAYKEASVQNAEWDAAHEEATRKKRNRLLSKQRKADKRAVAEERKSLDEAKVAAKDAERLDQERLDQQKAGIDVLEKKPKKKKKPKKPRRVAPEIGEADAELIAIDERRRRLQEKATQRAREQAQRLRAGNLQLESVEDEIFDELERSRTAITVRRLDYLGGQTDRLRGDGSVAPSRDEVPPGTDTALPLAGRGGRGVAPPPTPPVPPSGEEPPDDIEKSIAFQNLLKSVASRKQKEEEKRLEVELQQFIKEQNEKRKAGVQKVAEDKFRREQSFVKKQHDHILANIENAKRHEEEAIDFLIRKRDARIAESVRKERQLKDHLFKREAGREDTQESAQVGVRNEQLRLTRLSRTTGDDDIKAEEARVAEAVAEALTLAKERDEDPDWVKVLNELRKKRQQDTALFNRIAELEKGQQDKRKAISLSAGAGIEAETGQGLFSTGLDISPDDLIGLDDTVIEQYLKLQRLLEEISTEYDEMGSAAVAADKAGSASSRERLERIEKLRTLDAKVADSIKKNKEKWRTQDQKLADDIKKIEDLKQQRQFKNIEDLRKHYDTLLAHVRRVYGGIGKEAELQRQTGDVQLLEGQDVAAYQTQIDAALAKLDTKVAFKTKGQVEKHFKELERMMRESLSLKGWKPKEIEAEISKLGGKMKAAFAQVEKSTKSLTLGRDVVSQIDRVDQSLMSLSYRFTHVAFQFKMIGAAGIAAFAIPLKLAHEFSRETAKIAGIMSQIPNKMEGFESGSVESFEVASARIKTAILDLASSTVFSTQEVSAALKALSQTALTFEQSMLVVPRVLEFAAASDLQVAEAVRTLIGTMKAFGLQIQDTERIMNTLASAAFMTNAEVKDFAASFKYVGPIAAKAGMSIEETAAAIGKLAESGIRGSMAGTTLRRALSRLLAPTGKAAEYLDQFNIQVYDLQGNMIPLGDIMTQLQEKIGAVAGPAEQAGIMMELFGLRAGPGMVALLDQSSGTLKELIENIEKSNVVSAIAAGEAESLGGKLKILTDSWKNLVLAMGDATDDVPFFKEALGIITYLTNAIRKLIEVSSAAKAVITGGLGLTAIAGAGLLVLGVLGRLFTGVVSFMSIMFQLRSGKFDGIFNQMRLAWKGMGDTADHVRKKLDTSTLGIREMEIAMADARRVVDQFATSQANAAAQTDNFTGAINRQTSAAGGAKPLPGFIGPLQQKGELKLGPTLYTAPLSHPVLPKGFKRVQDYTKVDKAVAGLGAGFKRLGGRATTAFSAVGRFSGFLFTKFLPVIGQITLAFTLGKIALQAYPFLAAKFRKAFNLQTPIEHMEMLTEKMKEFRNIAALSTNDFYKLTEKFQKAYMDYARKGIAANSALIDELNAKMKKSTDKQSDEYAANEKKRDQAIKESKVLAESLQNITKAGGVDPFSAQAGANINTYFQRAQNAFSEFEKEINGGGLDKYIQRMSVVLAQTRELALAEAKLAGSRVLYDSESVAALDFQLKKQAEAIRIVQSDRYAAADAQAAIQSLVQGFGVIPAKVGGLNLVDLEDIEEQKEVFVKRYELLKDYTIGVEDEIFEKRSKIHKLSLELTQKEFDEQFFAAKEFRVRSLAALKKFQDLRSSSAKDGAKKEGEEGAGGAVEGIDKKSIAITKKILLDSLAANKKQQEAIQAEITKTHTLLMKNEEEILKQRKTNKEEYVKSFEIPDEALVPTAQFKRKSDELLTLWDKYRKAVIVGNKEAANDLLNKLKEVSDKGAGDLRSKISEAFAKTQEVRKKLGDDSLDQDARNALIKEGKRAELFLQQVGRKSKAGAKIIFDMRQQAFSREQLSPDDAMRADVVTEVDYLVQAEESRNKVAEARVATLEKERSALQDIGAQQQFNLEALKTESEVIKEEWRKFAQIQNLVITEIVDAFGPLEDHIEYLREQSKEFHVKLVVDSEELKDALGRDRGTLYKGEDEMRPDREADILRKEGEVFIPKVTANLNKFMNALSNELARLDRESPGDRATPESQTLLGLTLDRIGAQAFLDAVNADDGLKVNISDEGFLDITPELLALGKELRDAAVAKENAEYEEKTKRRVDVDAPAIVQLAQQIAKLTTEMKAGSNPRYGLFGVGFDYTKGAGGNQFANDPETTARLNAQNKALDALTATYAKVMGDSSVDFKELAKEGVEPVRAKLIELLAVIEDGTPTFDKLMSVIAALTNTNPTGNGGNYPGERWGGLIQHKRRGGSLPGYGGGDRRLHALEDGEYVMTKEATRAIGVNTLDAMRGMFTPGVQVTAPSPVGIPAMRTGGVVGGSGKDYGTFNIGVGGKLFPVTTDRMVAESLRRALDDLSKVRV